LSIDGGFATDDGGLGLAGTAVGGGLLINGPRVAIESAALMNNEAAGANGTNGTTGHSATTSRTTGGLGGNGGNGGDAQGGGIYLAAGSLTLTNDLLQGNGAVG